MWGPLAGLKEFKPKIQMISKNLKPFKLDLFQKGPSRAKKNQIKGKEDVQSNHVM
jgi:hypothetical protein